MSGTVIELSAMFVAKMTCQNQTVNQSINQSINQSSCYISKYIVYCSQLAVKKANN